MKKLFFTIFLLVIMIKTLWASSIAIIDSGVDVKHQDLISNIWTNPGETIENGIDDEKNGYIDDIFGWNFAENNNSVIDYKYVDLLNDDVRKFFEIQSASMTGDITDEDKEWVKTKLEDKKFVKKLGTYASFMHGTHVAGISSFDSNNKIVAIKLLATEVSTVVPQGFIGRGITKMILKPLANMQAKEFGKIAGYINFHNIPVANGSYGTGYFQAEAIITIIYKKLFHKKPKSKDLKKLIKYFLRKMNKANRNVLKLAPDTLFVFAAGNDGTNNDEYPISPASTKSPNVISVAATFGRNLLAPFSNFGISSVDVAAPGVNIESTIPGDNYLTVSGTSQAAPFVANVAGRIEDINPELGPSELKKIIMETVDKKDFLAAKVKSGGIVNSRRACLAAKFSLGMKLDDAIREAKIAVQDVRANKSMMLGRPLYMRELVLPLPGNFTI